MSKIQRWAALAADGELLQVGITSWGRFERQCLGLSCGGYMYKAPTFPEEPVRGSDRWGRTLTAALTRTVKCFDSEATLPLPRKEHST